MADVKTKGFWEALEKPIFILAPMVDVTDAPFRRMFAKYGKPDVIYTEFVSADGLFRGGYDALIHDLKFTEEERPIVAQFFSPNPALMKRAVELAVELGFDGVDLNMGCPAKNVCKEGSGAAMIRTPDKAREIIRAAQEGAQGRIPVSVKTRIGYNKIETKKWVSELLKENPVAIILHARTKKEMSKVPAHWDEIRKAVELRDSIGSDTLIIGNGDVSGLEEARERVNETGCDGIMIGRGIFGNPWFFNTDVDRENLSVEERLRVMVEHTRLYEELLGGVKPFVIMKKHFKAYTSGFDGAKELREQLMSAKDASEVEGVVEVFLKGRN